MPVGFGDNFSNAIAILDTIERFIWSFLIQPVVDTIHFFSFLFVCLSSVFLEASLSYCKIMRRQATFIGHVMRSKGLESHDNGSGRVKSPKITESLNPTISDFNEICIHVVREREGGRKRHER